MSRFLSNLFIPQSKNNYKAYLAQPGFLAILLSFYILNQSFIRSFALIKPGVLGYSSEISAQKVLNQTNEQRLKNGLPELKLNPSLSQSATAKAEHMFANNYWAHNAPDGTNPWYFFKQVGYEYQVAGENLAKDFYDTETMISAWMNSPTHRDNILNSKYKEIGIGVVNGTLSGIKTTLVVQHFGNPVVASAPAKQDIASRYQPVEVELPDASAQTVWGADTVDQTKPLISPLALSKIIGGAIFSLMVVVMFIDGLVTIKNKNYRLSSSVTGQISFLLVILGLLIFTKQGAIF